jgi:FAD/FMN-containing dehydrogenase/Fe-S oxidoreductase
LEQSTQTNSAVARPQYNPPMDFTAQKRQALIEFLRKHFSGEIRFDSTSRRLYSTDASIFQIEPLGVVIPRTTDDLVAVVQMAAETSTPIIARGGGTSLSGQSIGPGIVIDCSKFLNKVGPIDVSTRRVRVQPGVVLDHLNRVLSVHGLQFGPDVATASRATIGGMLGNNSAGARSIVYGNTVDHVHSLKTILSDGSSAEFGVVPENAWQRRAERTTLEGKIYRESRRIVEANADEIHKRFPRIIRRVSGYNLLDSLECRTSDRPSLIPMLVGSEGTLAVVAEAELNLVPKPKCRGLLVPHFDSLASALNALEACLEFKPSAVELMDTMLIELARRQLSLKNTMSAIHGQPAALLMVEFSGETSAEVSGKVHELERRLREIPGVTATVPAIDPSLRDPLWSLRQSAMPLLYGLPGDRKPVTFVEDCAVAPPRLPEFAGRFREILRIHGTDGAFYGHASVGCLHIRPLLNLKDVDDVKRMRAIMEDVTDLVLNFGGSLSGEHGDGLVRSEWNKKMFGPAVYEAFRQIKRAFDPSNLLNPGKVVDAPAMTDNWRLGPDYHPQPVGTIFDYSAQQGFFRSIELCNGSGVCRKTQGGAMCPSFRATRDERDNPRGRANALRLALAGEVNPVRAPMTDRWVYEVMELCLSCKACKSECPSNVDIAKLKAEFLHAYHAKHMRPFGHYFVGNIYRLNRFASHFAGIFNWLNRRGLSRWILERAAGIDHRRSLPEVHSNHFRKWFAARTPSSGGRRRVLLFDDCFSTFNEPGIGRAAVEVLERVGCNVELVKPDLLRARAAEQRLSEGGARAGPVANTGPGATRRRWDTDSRIGTELRAYFDGRMARTRTRFRVADDRGLGPSRRSMVGRTRESGKHLVPLSGEKRKCLFHGHCHQRALCGTAGSANALKMIPGLQVTALDAGCCGMAGAFGFEKRHYDLSVQIANLELLPALKAEPDAIIAATGTSCRHQIRDLRGEWRCIRSR